MAMKQLTTDRDKINDPRYQFVDSDHERTVDVDFDFGVRTLLLCHKYDVVISNVVSSNGGFSM